jgi:hypothetical protein
MSIGPLDSRFPECIINKKITKILIVMPDLIRHPEAQDAETALDSGSSPE